MKFPIDLVYMWVDGNDPVWQQKKQQYNPTITAETVQTAGEARWRDNDELLYSLRSVEKNAPWINHIYIITDGQCPRWLDTSNPKVTIVDHSEILPKEALPIFNSQAIESCIHKIKGLSEHFIVGNDDTLFVQPISPEHFFREDGRVIVRLTRFNRAKALRRGEYRMTIRRMQDLVNETFGELIELAPHHNFDAYLKSDYAHCVDTFYSEAWAQTARNRFRSSEDMQRAFISYYMIVVGHAEARKVGRYNQINGFWNALRATFTQRFATDSRCINLNSDNYDYALSKYNPLMICANDNEKATNDDGRRMSLFLASLFPEPSFFEKL